MAVGTSYSPGVHARRKLRGILAAADALPHSSSACRVLVAIGCRLQLFMLELEHAKQTFAGFESIDAMLLRLVGHLQLLQIAQQHQRQDAGAVQSGFALLAELQNLLQQLEVMVKKLPSYVGDALCPQSALNELHTLCGKVALYRSECESTYTRLEALVNDLAELPDPPADACSNQSPAAGGFATPAATSNGHCAMLPGSDMPDPEANNNLVGGTDHVAIIRARDVFLSLGLDVSACNQDIDAELCRLRQRLKRCRQVGSDALCADHSKRMRDQASSPCESCNGADAALAAAQQQLGGDADADPGPGIAVAVARQLALERLDELKQALQQQQQREQQQQVGSDILTVPAMAAAAAVAPAAHELSSAMVVDTLGATTSMSPTWHMVLQSAMSSDAALPECGEGEGLLAVANGSANYPGLMRATSDAQAQILRDGRWSSADGADVPARPAGTHQSASATNPVLSAAAVSSVMALRKLSRVTKLAGMWELGLPAQLQSSSAASPVGASGGLTRITECGPDDEPAPLAPQLPMGLPGADGASPFALMAMQGMVPGAAPPPVFRRLLMPFPAVEFWHPDAEAGQDKPHEADHQQQPQPHHHHHAVQQHQLAGQRLHNSRAVPAQPAGQRGHDESPGRQRGPQQGASPRHGAPGGGLPPPMPLPLPDASVHLRAVGLPGLMGQADADHNLGLELQLADVGVPQLDLQRDITGWGPCLGRGAFGAVYKALYRGRPAAVKVLHAGALELRDLRAFRSEISLLARLGSHPNIITLHGFACAPPDVALVTELMDFDLYDLIHRQRQDCVPLDEVISIARQIAAGLAELHPAVVHRDLKPANVLLARRGPGAALQATPTSGLGTLPVTAAQSHRLAVKIADFGLARHKPSQYLSSHERDAGTLKYMAPECIFGNHGGVTEKADIFSFGVLLYEMLSGREPWEGCHPLYAICQVQSGARPPLPTDPARCPAPLRELVERCWSGDHHVRPSSKELVQRLDEAEAWWRTSGLAEAGESVPVAPADSGLDTVPAQ